MFLVFRNGCKTIQTYDLTITSYLMEQVVKGEVQVFRFQRGRFEQLFSAAKVIPGDERIVMEWREVPLTA